MRDEDNHFLSLSLQSASNWNCTTSPPVQSDTNYFQVLNLIRFWSACRLRDMKVKNWQYIDRLWRSDGTDGWSGLALVRFKLFFHLLFSLSCSQCASIHTYSRIHIYMSSCPHVHIPVSTVSLFSCPPPHSNGASSKAHMNSSWALAGWSYNETILKCTFTIHSQ